MDAQNNYVGYEYKQITADKQNKSLWVDSMVNFGWTEAKSEAKLVKRMPLALWILAAPLSLLPGRPFAKGLQDHESSTQVQITFKRDRSQQQKPELNNLEAQFERCMQAMSGLEASQYTLASLVAILVGILGTACMAISVLAGLSGWSPVFLLAAVPGFLGWILPYFIYCTMRQTRARAIAPELERQQENIYELCKSGNAVLQQN